MLAKKFFPMIPLVLLAAPLLGISQAGPLERVVTVEKGAQDPAISPDGTQIAASILGKIWLLPASGGEARQVTFGIGWDTHPAFSPDGQFLAYAHHIPGGAGLVVLNLATGGSASLYRTEYAIGHIAYPPQGKSLFFLLDRDQLDSHLWSVPLNGGEAKQFSFTENHHEWSFAFSPDGKTVLLDHGRYGGSDVYTMELQTGDAVRQTQTPGHEFSVNWTADGKSFVYIGSEDGRDSVFIKPADGGEAKAVLSSPYDQKQVAVFPDGKSAVLCASRLLSRLDLSTGKTTAIPFKARFRLPPLEEPNFLITNARLFDGTGSPVVEKATIEVRNGRVAAVHKGETAVPPAPGVRVLDAAGKMVLPGMMDNHYHYWFPFDGPSLLMNGITAIRDPGSAVSWSLNFKDAVSLGVLDGPDIFTTGPLLDGNPGYHPLVDVEITRPEAAAELVQALKKQGVDAIKVYFMLNPEVLKALVVEAKKLGLKSTGHIGVRTGWGEALDAGIDGFCHLRVWHDFLPLDLQPDGTRESLDFRKDPVARMQSDWSMIDLESTPVRTLLRRIVDQGIGLDPTLAGQRFEDGQRKQFGFAQQKIAKDTYVRMKAFVKRAWETGAQILAGTDNGPYFDELEAYAEAGLPATAILQTATINGAKWLGKEKDFGTVEVGKRANLVLVEGDPLKNIKDLRAVAIVIKDGRIVFRK